LERDFEAYTRKCKANAINGKSGGRPLKRKTQNNPTKADSDNDNDNDNENDTNKNYNKKTFDDFHFSVAKSLTSFLEKKQNRVINKSQTEKWAIDIRLLMEKDLKNRDNTKDDVIKAMQAVIDKSGELYFPV